MNEKRVTVIGAGLAGCEAAWQLSKRGVKVLLVDMKPETRTPAHSMDGPAELVCSNSLRGAAIEGAVGLLKEELRVLGSLLITCAHKTAVPAGRALAVNRKLFSEAVESELQKDANIKIECREVDLLADEGEVIVATGPLTEGGILRELRNHGAILNYHDAIAPLVVADSIDFDRAFMADRYEDNEENAAYLNCPFDEQGYMDFVRELASAQKTPLRDFETAPFFEGCLPVEEMASRGPLTLAYGPLKPVGLRDPHTGKRQYAVVQLRREDIAGTSYNMVGFQTRLTRPEQKRVFRMIPGLEKATFERYGQVHRNTFVDGPRVLDSFLRLKNAHSITLAGQITGVEGYVESIASGYLAGRYVANKLAGTESVLPPLSTALGGIARHTAMPTENYQPSNIVWGMIETERRNKRKVKKRERRSLCAQKAIEEIKTWA